jgi:hypothetical protein
VRSGHEIRHAGTHFFALREVTSRKFLSRTSDTNVPTSRFKDKIFAVEFVPEHSAWTLKGRTRMYLTSETNNRVTVDRLWARSFERWTFEFDNKVSDGSSPGAFDAEDVATGAFRLKACRNSKYVSVFKDGRSLETQTDNPAPAARWQLFPVTSCNNDVDCWGPEASPFGGGGGGGHRHGKKGKKQNVKVPAGGDSNKAPPPTPARGALLERQTLPEFLNVQFPLFGSPKPLPSTQPKDASDAFDTVTIARRTIENWASINGMIPVMFSTDTTTISIVNEINARYEEHMKQLIRDGCVAGRNSTANAAQEPFASFRKSMTALHTDFELHATYKQPTYRGLFKRAFELYPDAPAVMYSNGDILYSPTLAQTIRRVASYFETEKRRAASAGVRFTPRGWMVVGQRINKVVPAAFAMREGYADAAAAATANDRTAADATEAGPGLLTCAGLRQLEKVQQLATRNDSTLQLQPRWVTDVENLAATGELFQSDAEDFFVVSRGLFDWATMPDFVVGGVAFDNWITGKVVHMALDGEAIIVDAVKTITALHQNDAKNIKKSHQSPKSQYNFDLAVRLGGWRDGHTSDAPLATERLEDGTVTVYDKHALLFT